MLRRKILGVFIIYAFLLPGFALAQAPVKAPYSAPKEDIEKIKKEGIDNSQVMTLLSYMTDVIGGRLTNSPNMKRANEWTRDTMAKWGMQNAKLEPWGPFGRGWSLKEFSAQVVSPQGIPVIAYPKAWSPSTKGMLTGDVVHVSIKQESDFDKYRGKLKGAIVLVGNDRELKADFDGMGHRYTDSELLEMANARNPALEPRRGRFDADPAQIQRFIEQRALSMKSLNFLLQEGAAVMVDNSFKGSGGTVFVSGASVAGEPPKSIEDIFSANSLSAYDKAAESKMIPQMTMATEDFNRLARMLKQDQKIKMSVNISAQYHDEDLMGYNTVAEIPGSDPALKDEIVMMGGHLDSWHASGGATDNAAGCAVAMEAARILIASGLKPRRTIRVALWSGEEQGLNGSREYVSQHFAGMEGGNRFMGGGKVIKKDGYENLSAYYNMDNGTGQFRGIYTQSNPFVESIFKTWLVPFKEWGASTVTLQNTGGTDHLSFDAVGLPGFQFIQDEIEYDERTHHSNQDNYDRLQPQDLMRNAVIMAAFAYQTAMMDDKMPRKPAN
ncbi:MAG: M20/M25/M40 family metallo-hydrolase [Pyrinomonadaceae bacterium]|nr:M20/M25/M40 family metallo-hydrolase [Pyrinomonadaceae bacterium]